MKTILSIALFLSFGAPAVAQAGGDEKKKESEDAGSSWSVKWKNGTRIENADGSIKIKLGGRIHLDTAFIAEDDDLELLIPGGPGGNLDDGVEFRRVRFFISGTIFERFFFKTQFDFEDGDASFKDVYLGVTFPDLPVLDKVTVGQQWEGVGFNAPPSNNYTFMEGPLDTSFTPQRNTGIRADGNFLEHRVHWNLGFFKNTDAFGDDVGDHGWNMSLRVSGLPILQEAMMLHVGMSYSLRNPDEGSYSFEAKPQSNIAGDWVETKLTDVDFIHLIGGELGFVWNSLHASAELVYALTDRDSGDEPNFFAFYFQVGYFLTGEMRPYSKKKATWGRVNPEADLFSEGGWGAVELKIRFTWHDTTDDSFHGGELSVFSFGANWYLTNFFRVMLDISYAAVDDLGTGNPDDGDGWIFQWRFQVDF